MMEESYGYEEEDYTTPEPISSDAAHPPSAYETYHQTYDEEEFGHEEEEDAPEEYEPPADYYQQRVAHAYPGK